MGKLIQEPVEPEEQDDCKNRYHNKLLKKHPIDENLVVFLLIPLFPILFFITMPLILLLISIFLILIKPLVKLILLLLFITAIHVLIVLFLILVEIVILLSKVILEPVVFPLVLVEIFHPVGSSALLEISVLS